MVVIMDINEPKDIENMLKNINVEVIRKKLYVGDYVVEGNNGTVAVERKAITDYINSLVSGRLNNQLYNLSTYYEYSFLAIVGYISYALMYSKFKREAYIASLVSSSLKRSPTGKTGQIIIINLETDFDFALFIKSLQKFLDEKELYRIPRLVVKDKKDILSTPLTAIPGIGEEKAKKIMEEFGSLYNLCKADVKEIMKVEGIGKKTAEKIYRFLRGDVNE